MHPSGVADPASPNFHGRALRALSYAPMLSASDDEACGRCHDGAPSRPPGVTFAAPGATACTTCHQEKAGVLACATCHGNGPPAPHLAHMLPTATHAKGFDCAGCNPMPGPGVVGGRHANGTVDVVLTSAPTAPGDAFDPLTKTCVVACHDRGGARSKPTWAAAATPLGCGDCHAAPPTNHFPGACASCHREASAVGDALSGFPLHLNGVVDLGDGSGGCSACHGCWRRA